MPIPRLQLVTPPEVARPVIEVVQAALDAGAPWLQIRTKEATDRARLDHAAALVERCRAAGAIYLVNDRVDIALSVGAHGVHLGDADLPPATARRLLGPDALIGVTCRDPGAARRAEAAGADYVGAGPTYPTTTKAGLPPPLGPRGIEAIASTVGIPVIAIAGVTVERVPELLDAGAWGVAVVGAVFSASDPPAAVRDLLAALGRPAQHQPAGSSSRPSGSSSRPAGGNGGSRS
jgi:thiamine-phosphate pyrophosphorylase